MKTRPNFRNIAAIVIILPLLSLAHLFGGETKTRTTRIVTDKEVATILEQYFLIEELAAAGIDVYSDSGAPVPDDVADSLEDALGGDFEAVRIHEQGDPTSASNTRARAFTHGNDILSAKGESNPYQNLMSHELSHVLTQTSGDEDSRDANESGNNPDGGSDSDGGGQNDGGGDTGGNESE